MYQAITRRKSFKNLRKRIEEISCDTVESGSPKPVSRQATMWLLVTPQGRPLLAMLKISVEGIFGGQYPKTDDKTFKLCLCKVLEETMRT